MNQGVRLLETTRGPQKDDGAVVIPYVKYKKTLSFFLLFRLNT